MVAINESLTVDLTLKTQQWQKGLDKASRGSDQFVDGLNKMNQKLTKILIEMKRVGTQGSKGIDKADKAVKKLNKSAKTGASAIGGMKTAMLSFAAAAGGIAFFSSAIESAREFETAIREVMTILPQGSLSMQETEKIVNDLALTMGEDAPKAARAMYQAISAGVEPKKAKAFLEEAATLAIAGVTNLETSVDLLTSVTNAYGLEIENAGALSDSLFETVRLGKTTIEELAAVMGRVAPTANAAGVGIIEVEGALAALTSVGVKTKEAGVQVVAMINSIIGPSEGAAKLAAQLGIEFNAQALEAEGLEGFLNKVAEATGGDIAMMKQLFPSSRALNGALSLTGAAADKFAKSIDSITVAGGKAKDAQKIMAAGFSFNMKVIESAAKQGQASVGKSMIEMIFSTEKAGDQSAVFALKVKAFFKDVEVAVGFLINQVFRRAIVGMKFLGMNAVNVGKTLLDAFEVSISEIQVLFLKLQITANDVMEFLGIVDEDIDFGRALKKELEEAQKVAERGLGDVIDAATSRLEKNAIALSNSLDEIAKKHKLTIKAAGEANNLRVEAEILSKKIAKAAGDTAKAEKNIADKLKTQTALMKQQIQVRKALAGKEAKEDLQRQTEDFAFDIQLSLDRALRQGLTKRGADSLSSFVEKAINAGTDFSEIQEQFNEKLNDALTKGAVSSFRASERQTKAALRESKPRIQKTAREVIEQGWSEGTRRARPFFSKVLTLTLKQAMEDTRAGVSRLPKISGVVAQLNFKTEKEGRDSLRRSQRLFEQSLGFSRLVNTGFGSVPGDPLNRGFGFSEGGEVKGPQVNRDVVSARLTPGEYVVNRQASQAFLPLLQAINRQTIVPQVNNTNVNLGGVNVESQGGLTDEMIDDQIIPRLRQLMRFNRL